MAWLKKADLVEVITTDPGGTVSGTCPFCAAMEGRPVSEVGEPPFHKNCACGTETTQTSTQPEDVIDDEIDLSKPFSIGQPEEEEEGPGGVTDLKDEEPLDLFEDDDE